MDKRRKKFIKVILSIVMVLAVIGFVVNWFLTYRLESFLRKELSERVAKATDGFYQLDFDKLEVGLFNGELTLEGLVFKPDSTVFEEWAAQDSLPQMYLDVAIGRIHFKGVNLTWKISYKELNFELFEINTPFVNVYDSSNSGKMAKKTKNTKSRTLYELISPYINVLTVKRMNLESASVIYSALKQSSLSMYSLRNVSFHAYGFRLDEYSYTKGKLLYCDDFDFITNQPQILLSNNQFILNTDTIKLSTRDSIIQINKLALIPQKMQWAQTKRIPDNYVEAEIKSVDVAGVTFKRENAQNYLNARSFDILASDIQYFDTQKDSLKTKATNKKTSITPQEAVDLSWSLYEIVSPLLTSINIDSIGIKEAQMSYSVKSDDYTDLYKLAKFNFGAKGFRVDSLADIQKKFLYSDAFSVEALDIDGTIASKNHIFRIGKMFLNTLEGNFNIKDVRLWPITTQTELDYTQGSIDSISVTGLEYDKGLKAKSFSIDAPKVEYVKMPARRRHYVRAERTDTIMEGTTPLDFITPFFGFLSVEDVRLNNGNLIFNDRRNPKDIMVYKLPRIDFHATNVLVNEHTITQTDTYVNYDDFDFRFENFDNFLPGKQYRLIVKRGFYTGWGGDLHLKDIRLIPQEHSWKQAPDVYLSLNTPSIDVKELNYDVDKGLDIIKLKSVDINSPQLRIVRTRNSQTKTSGSTNKDSSFRIDLGLFNLIKADVRYKDHVTRDSMNFSTENFVVKSLAWNSGEKFTVQELSLHTPVLNIKKHNESKSNVNNGESSDISSFARLVDIGKINVWGMKVNLDQPSLKFNTKVDLITIDDMTKNSSSFHLGSMEIKQPIVKINQIINSDKIKEDTLTSKQDKENRLYATLGSFTKQMSVGKFNIIDAEIDYSNTLNGKSANRQQINSTNFDFTGLALNVDEEKISVEDFNFSTKNFHFPLDNGFYTMQIGEIDVHKKDAMLKLDKLHLVPAYPKEEFAYQHPKHKDWFDVSVGNVVLSGIDYPTYFSNKILNIKKASVQDVQLLNFKNQQIEIQHNIMPMIYEGLQKAPLKLNIENADVKNFMVLYEELPKKGTESGKIFFTDMNGKLEGLTNVVTYPQQYIKLDADGKLMGTGHFTATWYLPVDSLNDRFLLTANLDRFELTDLNQLITPMAPAKVNGGVLNNLKFKTEASSKGARVQMRFLYNGLNITVFKDSEEGVIPNKLYTNLANAVLKKDNPDKRKKKPREPFLSIERDPYHSTFNYLWQILQPPLIESVGISQGKQNFFKGVSNVITKVKNFFSRKKKDNEDKVEKE
ncbi:hypothetical protein LJC00_00435 [Dysgonomonas sp. OttesenSCG-928-M03]|nr:hypothetical protein [Dysgonomonas sp. OttesenSCG-928-M03]